MNSVHLVGNLGKDPDCSIGGQGADRARFSLATSRRWKDRETGERRDETDWHQVVVFGAAAQVIADYVRKGSKIGVTGELRTRKYEKDGQDRWVTEVIVGGRGQIELLDRKEQAGGPRSAPPPSSADYRDIDDDIPF